jgi:cell division protein FtsL
MNSNIYILIASVILASIFLGGVFLNLGIKNSKEEVVKLESDIKDIKLDIKRKKIEITTLINPHNVFDYIDKKGLKPVPLRNVDVVVLKND